MTSQSESRKTQPSLITLRQLCRSTSLDWVTPDPALPGLSVTNSDEHSRGRPPARRPARADPRCTDGGYAPGRVACSPDRRHPPIPLVRTAAPAPRPSSTGRRRRARHRVRAGQRGCTGPARGAGRRGRTGGTGRPGGSITDPARRTAAARRPGIRSPIAPERGRAGPARPTAGPPAPATGTVARSGSPGAAEQRRHRGPTNPRRHAPSRTVTRVASRPGACGVRLDGRRLGRSGRPARHPSSRRGDPRSRRTVRSRRGDGLITIRSRPRRARPGPAPARPRRPPAAARTGSSSRGCP